MKVFLHSIATPGGYAGAYSEKANFEPYPDTTSTSLGGLLIISYHRSKEQSDLQTLELN